MCTASRQGGVGRIRHLDGRLLWIQQRQGRDFQLRRVDTASSPADMGTKCLAAKRVKMLNLLGFTNRMQDLGWYELEEEIVKKQNKEKIQAIRKVVHAEALEAGQSQSSIPDESTGEKADEVDIAGTSFDWW